MKTRKMNLYVVGVLMLFSFLFSSCNDDDKYLIVPKTYRSWFTVKVEDGSFYYQHDKGKTFLPVGGWIGYTPKKDHRALVYYEVALEKDSKEFDYPIYVYRVDTILSKAIVPYPDKDIESVYGSDPVRIDKMWVGSDFLTVRFTTQWGGHKAHFVNLVQENEENPYELTFRHNANDDPKYTWGYGWVAFNLADLPPTDNEDGEVELTIKIKTYEGTLEKTFTYTPGQLDDEGEEPGGDEEDEEPEIDETMIRFL